MKTSYLPFDYFTGEAKKKQSKPHTNDIIYSMLTKKIDLKYNFVFPTDSYEPESIKAQEIMRRGSSDKFVLDGPATRKPTYFKLFLPNEENKQLCNCFFRCGESSQQHRALRNVAHPLWQLMEELISWSPHMIHVNKS